MENNKLNLALITGGTVGGVAVFAAPQPVFAISVADVNTQLNTVITNTDAAADIAWPIGAALISLYCIGTVFKRFLLGTGS